MSMQTVVSPAITLTPAKRTSLTHIPGDEGWPIVGRTLSILADPKGEVERMAAKYGLIYRSRVLGETSLTLLGGKLLRCDVGLTVAIGDGRIELESIKGAIGFSKKDNAVANPYLGAHFDGDGELRILCDRLSRRRPYWCVIEQDHNVGFAINEVSTYTGVGKRIVGIEMPRSIYAQSFRFENPGTMGIVAAGHPVKIQRPRISQPGAGIKEFRVGEFKGNGTEILEFGPFADDARAGIDHVRPGCGQRLSPQGEI